jgi:hypothetical protein
MCSTATPEYPLRVFFDDDGEEQVFDNAMEAECTLEWFDSDDPGQQAHVVDAKGRAVRLVIDTHRVVVCALR